MSQDIEGMHTATEPVITRCSECNTEKPNGMTTSFLALDINSIFDFEQVMAGANLISFSSEGGTLWVTKVR